MPHTAGVISLLCKWHGFNRTPNGHVSISSHETTLSKKSMMEDLLVVRRKRPVTASVSVAGRPHGQTLRPETHRLIRRRAWKVAMSGVSILRPFSKLAKVLYNDNVFTYAIDVEKLCFTAKLASLV